MTREEAVAVLKAFMENPLFSDEHKAAFNIAIHDIKQRHDWDINKLMLVPKTEWEQDHAILKAYSDGANEVLDKIRAEVLEEILSHSGTGEEVIQAYADGLKKGLEFIDKLKAESEE